MGKRKIFTKPVTFLIVTGIAITALTEGELRSNLTLGVFILTGLWLLVSFIGARFGKLKHALRKRQKRIKVTGSKKVRIISRQSTPEVVTAALMRHINHRISDYLKSAYPDVTWEWVSEQPEKAVVKGGTGRIRLFNIPDFNYADVLFNRMAQIECDFLRVVPFAELKTDSGVPAEEIRPNQPVNLEAWYSIQGKSTLESCISELNSHGFSTLSIKENGDICVKKGDKEVACETLKQFPGKQCRQSLVDMLSKAGWAASVSENGIAVSW
jgi:hypothetical protein